MEFIFRTVDEDMSDWRRGKKMFLIVVLHLSMLECLVHLMENVVVGKAIFRGTNYLSVHESLEFLRKSFDFQF